jgi:hypothetical protein
MENCKMKDSWSKVKATKLKDNEVEVVERAESKEKKTKEVISFRTNMYVECRNESNEMTIVCRSHYLEW